MCVCVFVCLCVCVCVFVCLCVGVLVCWCVGVGRETGKGVEREKWWNRHNTNIKHHDCTNNNNRFNSVGGW